MSYSFTNIIHFRPERSSLKCASLIENEILLHCAPRIKDTIINRILLYIRKSMWLLKWFFWSVKFSLILKVLLNPIRTDHLMFFINISRIIIYNSGLSCWIYIFCYLETIFVYCLEQHTRNSWGEWHTDHVSYLFVCQKRSVHLLQVYLCDFSLMIIYRISLQILYKWMIHDLTPEIVPISNCSFTNISAWTLIQWSRS